MRSWFLFFFVCFVPVSLAVTVDMKGPSVFFGTHEPDLEFDYKSWVGRKALFRNAFDEEAWDKKAPVPRANAQLSREEAEYLLLRFNKPGGFQEKNRPLLEELLATTLIDDSPYVVAGAMQNVLQTSRKLYAALCKKFEKLKHLDLRSHAANPFRTKDEEATLIAQALDYLEDEEEALLEKGTVVEDWLHLLPLAPLYHTMDSDDRISHEDWIMESIMDRAQDREFKDSGSAYLFPVIEPAIEHLMGDRPEVVTTLEMTRKGDTFVPRLHGTHPIVGLAEKRNIYGFYSVDLPSFTYEEAIQGPREFLWGMYDHRFKAEVNFDAIPKGAPLYPKEVAPPYQKMHVDGALNLLVVFGSNIKDSLKEGIISFKSWLKELNFAPDKGRRLTEFSKWFQEEVESGPTTFIDKEAHATADVDNFLEVDETARVLVFKRQTDDGFSQVIRIVEPYSKDSETTTISNQQFGKWLKKREENTNYPLLYSNMSCWSVDQARLQIPEFQSSLFRQIFSTTVVDEFQNLPESAVRVVLEGFLNHEDYPTMRKALSKNKDYVNGTSDVVHFPDEPHYEQLAYQGGTPVRLRWKIWDETKNRRYYGDDLYSSKK